MVERSLSSAFQLSPMTPLASRSLDKTSSWRVPFFLVVLVLPFLSFHLPATNGSANGNYSIIYPCPPCLEIAMPSGQHCFGTFSFPAGFSPSAALASLSSLVEVGKNAASRAVSRISRQT